MDASALLSTTIAELALSADNAMVWALIMKRLDVPQRQQRAVLAGGLGIAIVMRVGAVVVGAQALERVHWLTYALGAVLLLTAWRVWSSEESDGDGGGLVRWAKRFGSPAIAATVALGATDLVFAVDSIPASFGLTDDPAVIITANAVALCALWFMYGTVSKLIDRLVHLTKGLVVVLAWVGATMILPIEVPELVNLGVIVGVIGGSVALSLSKIRQEV